MDGSVHTYSANLNRVWRDPKFRLPDRYGIIQDCRSSQGRSRRREGRNLKTTKRYESIREQAAVLFAKKGYNAVGVAELGEATGLGRGALYHHIDCKEDLLYDISSTYIQQLVEEGRQIAAREPDPIERIKQLSCRMIDTVFQHLPEMTVCFREIHALSGERHREVTQLHQDYQQIWEDAIAVGVATGAFKPIEKVAVKGLMGMFFYSFLWINPNGKQTADEIGDAFSSFIIRSLTAE
ncbi:TetR/AcrR family transcriptional regulator [Hoeflea prorocentri]|uniref:TetR/AcrR family transcriptional regulator n=1 Tax=Hoeflea prorocentri TaxID=1922333 RepID=A0A9X3ZIU2_9HYPH|nr:TetR/AcrR family transcriptional regulator [Hoeflea prorocentri]MCY6383262.1 TetR/AcrR family transcriptional regulator [Hoeflea prorocentri]MDA5401062.1 TetR/AcrR family transcriptional regulator [Hoeflea prorocentri]